jgi:hypothetical protein
MENVVAMKEHTAFEMKSFVDSIQRETRRKERDMYLPSSKRRASAMSHTASESGLGTTGTRSSSFDFEF